MPAIPPTHPLRHRGSTLHCDEMQVGIDAVDAHSMSDGSTDDACDAESGIPLEDAGGPCLKDIEFMATCSPPRDDISYMPMCPFEEPKRVIA